MHGTPTFEAQWVSPVSFRTLHPCVHLHARSLHARAIHVPSRPFCSTQQQPRRAIAQRTKPPAQRTAPRHIRQARPGPPMHDSRTLQPLFLQLSLTSRLALMQVGNRHQRPSYSKLHSEPLDIACAFSACMFSSCKLAHFLLFLRWFMLPRACWADNYSRLAPLSPCSS